MVQTHRPRVSAVRGPDKGEATVQKATRLRTRQNVFRGFCRTVQGWESVSDGTGKKRRLGPRCRFTTRREKLTVIFLKDCSPL
jgi:hypothetical protein